MSLLVGCAPGVLMLNDRHWSRGASGEGVNSSCWLRGSLHYGPRWW